MVAGQPGSGKNTAIRQAEMGLAGAIQKIIGDDFDAWVPGYYDLAKERPREDVRCARTAGSKYLNGGTGAEDAGEPWPVSERPPPGIASSVAAAPESRPGHPISRLNQQVPPNEGLPSRGERYPLSLART